MSNWHPSMRFPWMCRLSPGWGRGDDKWLWMKRGGGRKWMKHKRTSFAEDTTAVLVSTSTLIHTEHCLHILSQPFTWLPFRCRRRLLPGQVDQSAGRSVGGGAARCRNKYNGHSLPAVVPVEHCNGRDDDGGIERMAPHLVFVGAKQEQQQHVTWNKEIWKLDSSRCIVASFCNFSVPVCNPHPLPFIVPSTVRMVNFMQSVSCCPRTDDLDIVHFTSESGTEWWLWRKEFIYWLNSFNSWLGKCINSVF